MSAIARTRGGRPTLVRAGLFSLADGGVAFAVLLLIVGYQSGQFLVDSGDVMMFERVGAALRSGGEVYAEQGDQGIAATFSTRRPGLSCSVSWDYSRRRHSTRSSHSRTFLLSG